MDDQKSSLGLLFDLSFTEFLTTRIIKILFIIGVVFSGIGALIALWSGLKGGALSGLLALIYSPLLFLLWCLLARIWCELIIVAFRIAENTSRLVDQAKAE